MEILKIRANEEKIKIEDEGLEYLTEIGEKTSLRYSVQLLSPASEVAKLSKKEKVGKEEIKRVKGLFADVKRSARYVRKHEREFLIGTSDEDFD